MIKKNGEATTGGGIHLHEMTGLHLEAEMLRTRKAYAAGGT